MGLISMKRLSSNAMTVKKNRQWATGMITLAGGNDDGGGVIDARRSMTYTQQSMV